MYGRQMIDHHQTLKSLASLLGPSVGSELQNFRQKTLIFIDIYCTAAAKVGAFYMILFPLKCLEEITTLSLSSSGYD